MTIKLFREILFLPGILLFISFPAFASGITRNDDLNIIEIEPLKSSDLNDLQSYNLKICSELIKAIDEKRFLVPYNVEIQLNQLAVNGFAILSEKKTFGLNQEMLIKHKAYASKELLDLLIALVNAPEINSENPISVFSFLRLGGAHGEIQDNGDLIGRAIDIDYFAGNKIHMEKPDKALEAILKVIKNLPPLRFSLGLPRPEGGNKIDPEKDFFLPVTNLNQARRSPTGNLKGDLNEIKNEDAKNKLKEVIENLNAEILFLYPDGIDHLHIKTVEQGKNQ